jgi:hypothetical protein
MEKDLIAVFGLRDSLRPDAIKVIDDLKRRSVEIFSYGLWNQRRLCGLRLL